MSEITAKNELQQTLKINEIFISIQGESTYAGLPCVFVRLSHCNLRCSWCDTAYAFYEGQDRTLAELIEKVDTYDTNLVEITGGEPLIQKNVLPLMRHLCDAGYQVLLETGGHMDISAVDKRVTRIMDLKCPSSGESQKNRLENFQHLKETDQIKCVIGDRNDYDWAVNMIRQYHLDKKCTVLFSPVYDRINYQRLAEWILTDRLPVRFQLQLHKFIWPADRRGV